MIAEVLQYVAVASFAEAWIEIFFRLRTGKSWQVASFAEAWIEIVFLPPNALRTSPPSRRRGLKYLLWMGKRKWMEVASFAEAWIEISLYTHDT